MGAAKPTIPATGHVRCEGTLKLRAYLIAVIPLLTPRADGSTVRVPVKGTLPCTGTTGNSKVRVTTLKVQGVLVRTFESVFDSLWSGVKPTPWTFNLKWHSVGGRLNPSTVTFTNYKGTDWHPPAPPSASIVMPVAPGGTSIVSGSYAGSSTGTLSMQFLPPWLGVFGWADQMSNPYAAVSNSARAKAVLTL